MRKLPSLVTTWLKQVNKVRYFASQTVVLHNTQKCGAILLRTLPGLQSALLEELQNNINATAAQILPYRPSVVCLPALKRPKKPFDAYYSLDSNARTILTFREVIKLILINVRLIDSVWLRLTSEKSWNTYAELSIIVQETIQINSLCSNDLKVELWTEESSKLRYRRPLIKSAVEAGVQLAFADVNEFATSNILLALDLYEQNCSLLVNIAARESDHDHIEESKAEIIPSWSLKDNNPSTKQDNLFENKEVDTLRESNDKLIAASLVNILEPMIHSLEKKFIKEQIVKNKNSIITKNENVVLWDPYCSKNSLIFSLLNCLLKLPAIDLPKSEAIKTSTIIEPIKDLDEIWTNCVPIRSSRFLETFEIIGSCSDNPALEKKAKKLQQWLNESEFINIINKVLNKNDLSLHNINFKNLNKVISANKEIIKKKNKNINIFKLPIKLILCYSENLELISKSIEKPIIITAFPGNRSLLKLYDLRNEFDLKVIEFDRLLGSRPSDWKDVIVYVETGRFISRSQLLWTTLKKIILNNGMSGEILRWTGNYKSNWRFSISSIIDNEEENNI